ncbi:MAG TPA: substrate-binding domain-containing protein [Burkholderiales bacterium]|nr:substrate-binding domain-containing protein [Burkholderiales bacterium]
MFKMSIKPQWLVEGPDAVRRPLHQLIELLTGMDEAGQLAAAAKKLDVSYRYAWELVRGGSRIFGAPLVAMTRGRGAVLTPLGEKLLWANKRIAARLDPTLDSLASELEVEIERVLSNVKPSIRIHASHGFAIGMLRDFLLSMHLPVELKYRGSMEALASLAESNCELAGFHMVTGSLQAPMLTFYARWLDPKSQTLINLATRRQGIMTAPGNPKKILSVEDLARPGVRFVNRQFGSGTRILLDLLLKQHGVDTRGIAGYASGETTHAAIAAYIASGMADAGFGVEAAARRMGQDFIPIINERYFLVCSKETLGLPMVERIRGVLGGPHFRVAAASLPGIDITEAGTTVPIDEAFPDLAAATAKAGETRTAQAERRL